MTRSQRMRLSVLLAVLPGVFGFKGCYFGNDQVPLGSNASEDGGRSAEDSSETGAGEGGGAGQRDRTVDVVVDDHSDIDVVAFQFGLTQLQLEASNAEGGSAGAPASP